MRPKLIRRTGVVLLCGGLIAAVIIYATAPPDVKAGILGVDIRTNRDRMQLERMGGKSYVMLKDLDDWFASLWHGRRLGITVGVLSAFGFLLCRGLARVEEDLAVDESQQRAKAPTSSPP